MFGKSTSSFDRLLEKATSQLLLEPDWDSILQICDCIRQGDISSKNALIGIKKKIGHDNPHVCMFALQVLESTVKNCGSMMHSEITTMEFMEFLKDLVKVRPDPVKTKILELIQCWSHAFRNEGNYRAVMDTFHLMKMEGYTFPVMKESDAMFVAEKAPEWKDGECCHRCRVQFTVVQRKHHCRNCGQVFCHKCSSRNSIIPKFGIEREVRVCEDCFDKLNKSANAKKAGEDDLPAEYLASPLSQQSQVPAARSEQELQEEEELQLAIALSKSEAETKEKTKRRSAGSYGTDTSSSTPTYSAPVSQTPMIDTSDMDPELARYLDRNYWNQKQDGTVSLPVTISTQPSAPTSNEAKTSSTVNVSEKYQNGEVNDEQQFLNALRSSVEIFVNRMKSNQARGRSIANDSSVQTLFLTINQMHPQLLKYVNEQDEARAHYEGLQDKLAQLRDAREALDALRQEHRLKKQREMEELERQRQIQMAQKLELLRIEKVKYLESQRQMMLQQMQEHERQMSMHLEKQKQMQQMRAMHGGYMPGYQAPYGYPQPGATFSPAGSVEGSPHHQPSMPGMAPPYMMAGSQPGGMPPYCQPGYTAPLQGPMAAGYQPSYPGYQPPMVGQPMQPPPPATNHQGYGSMQPPPGQDYSGYNVQGLPGGPPGQVPHSQAPPVSQGYMPPSGYSAPPVQGMMAPQQGQPPQQQGMPPNQGQPPQQQGMPPSQGQPPQQQGMPPSQGMPPQQVPGMQPNMPMQGHHMPPQGQHMPPQGQHIPPQGQHIPPQGQHMPPQGQPMPPPGHGMPPPGQHMPPPGPPMVGDPSQGPPPQQSQEASLISFD